MKKCHVYCDNCSNEVDYYLVARYNVDDVLKDILRRNLIDIEHLCEACMSKLKDKISIAVKEWNKYFVKNDNE